jgi:hypothetical protein
MCDGPQLLYSCTRGLTKMMPKYVAKDGQQETTSRYEDTVTETHFT